jgi:hypothetical protein
MMNRWKDMPKAEKLSIVKALFVDGKIIEHSLNGEDWKNFYHVDVNFWSEHYYRIKTTKPSIDWSHVSDEYKWMATDEDGRTFLFCSFPWVDGSYWCTKNNSVDCEGFASFELGTCDWKDSLVERPKE